VVCKDGAAEIDFCLATFGAVELNKRMGPDNMMAHALLTIGNETITVNKCFFNGGFGVLITFGFFI